MNERETPALARRGVLLLRVLGAVRRLCRSALAPDGGEHEPGRLQSVQFPGHGSDLMRARGAWRHGRTQAAVFRRMGVAGQSAVAARGALGGLVGRSPDHPPAHADAGDRGVFRVLRRGALLHARHHPPHRPDVPGVRGVFRRPGHTAAALWRDERGGTGRPLEWGLFAQAIAGTGHLPRHPGPELARRARHGMGQDRPLPRDPVLHGRAAHGQVADGLALRFRHSPSEPDDAGQFLVPGRAPVGLLWHGGGGDRNSRAVHPRFD